MRRYVKVADLQLNLPEKLLKLREKINDSKYLDIAIDSLAFSMANQMILENSVPDEHLI